MPDTSAPPETTQSERIQRLRAASRDRAAKPPLGKRGVNIDEAFFGRYASKPFWERYARSMAAALVAEPVYLFPDEHLTGMLYQIGPQAEPDAGYAARWRPYSAHEAIRIRQAAEIEPHLRTGAGQGHIGWHWEWLLKYGIDGVIRDLRERLAHSSDRQAQRLFKGALIMWRAVLDWNELHIQALQQSAASASGQELDQLRSSIRICQRVPRYPAASFHEAVQCFYFQHLALMFENPYGGNGPGRVDQLLWPYLERDLSRGIITWQGARDLVDELLIRFDERLFLGDGWVEAVTVGGSLPDGTSTVNPLSYLIVQSYIGLDQTHPSVYIRLNRNSPDAFMDLTTRYLLEGGNRAQVYNDDACLPAIHSGGVTMPDAAEFMAGGCMEPSSQGRASDLNFSCVQSVAKTLELVLNGGVDLLTGEQRIKLSRTLTSYPTFEDLYRAFEDELSREYHAITRSLDIASEELARYRPCYLLSSLVDDCLERGREQQDGGARYHDYGFAPLGITAAADSLHAIHQAVYQSQLVAPDALLAALRTNYQGAEPLRAMLNSIPRFGQDDTGADAMAVRVLKSVCDAAGKQRTRFDGRLKPMVFNFVWTPGFSAELGALADGSRAGHPLGHGLTPRKIAMGQGITVAMSSSLKLDTSTLTGIGTTMWDVDERWITPRLMKALLLSFLGGGGMVFQGNTTSVRDLQQALEHPELYRHLIVRVGGFSARFVSLERALQDEIISRYRHAA
ncbi:MAG: pyruvate formate lyase family protein [Anaerolineae bacterium]